jgi:hypothetical protein
MFYGSRPPIVQAEPPVSCGGWQIATGFAAGVAAVNSRNFYAVYSGDAFGHAERGVIAIMAQAHAGTADAAARDAVQSVVHAVAEGYFGAARTLSARRAMGLSLGAINSWLFGQRRGGAHHLPAVSLTAVLFDGARLGLVQIGAVQVFRTRGSFVTPLMRPHRSFTSEGLPTRAIGLDPELPIDFAEEEFLNADRFLLIGGAGAEPEDVLPARLTKLSATSQEAGELAAQLLKLLGPGDTAAMVLDLLAAPSADVGREFQNFENLPLRPEPREGDVWDGFTLGKTLYRGRYTILKAACDTIENRQVALKIPLPTMLQDEIFAAGFMREARIGSTVRGSAVVRYIELPPERRSSLYLVMPLYHGETLEARLHRAPPVSLPEGLGIALKLCEAVQDLAAIQIVHRDIKPDNVMILETREIRLLDLGLAYLPGIDLADAVKPGGTIRYMAPELLDGVAASARTEIYALGVTIYRMFCGGAFPFGQRERVPLTRLRPDLPHWLGLLLRRALDADPAARFADAGAFARALQRGLIDATESDPARSVSRFPRIRIWQALTVFFAAGFLLLLLRDLR